MLTRARSIFYGASFKHFMSIHESVMDNSDISECATCEKWGPILLDRLRAFCEFM